MLAGFFEVFNHLETLAKTFFIPSRQNLFIQENISTNAPLRRIAIAMITNSALTGSYTENPFLFQHSDLRIFRILRGDQTLVEFDTPNNCDLNVTTLKAMND